MLIVLPATYSGQFHIGSGPCDAVEGSPVPGPDKSPSSGEFTVVEAGLYVAMVTIEEGPVGSLTGSPPPSSLTVDCHQDVCTLALGNLSYGLGSSEAE
jgi:hypothetical protein